MHTSKPASDDGNDIQCGVSAVYASAVYAVIVCPSVYLSVTSRSLIKTAERIELGFGMGVSFHLSHSVL